MGLAMFFAVLQIALINQKYHDYQTNKENHKPRRKSRRVEAYQNHKPYQDKATCIPQTCWASPARRKFKQISQIPKPKK